MSSTQARDFEFYYDRLIELWPNPPKQSKFRTLSGVTHFLELGCSTSPPLILLPGANLTAAMWGDLASMMAEKFWVICPDLIGDIGKSQSIDSLKDLIGVKRWFLEFVSELGLAEYYLAGYSYGGWLAWQLQSSLVGCQKMGLISPAGLLSYRFGFMVRCLYSIMFAKKAIVRDFYHYCARGTHEALPELQDRFEALLDLVSEGSKGPSNILLPRRLSGKVIRETSVPIHVIVGNQEVMYDGRSGVMRVKRLLPSANTLLIDNGSHIIPFTHTRQIADALNGFFLGPE